MFQIDSTVASGTIVWSFVQIISESCLPSFVDLVDPNTPQFFARIGVQCVDKFTGDLVQKIQRKALRKNVNDLRLCQLPFTGAIQAIFGCLVVVVVARGSSHLTKMSKVRHVVQVIGKSIAING